MIQSTRSGPGFPWTHGVRLMGKLLDEIVPSIQKTSELVQEIAAASAEQSESAVQIGGAMGQLSQATQQNASASKEPGGHPRRSCPGRPSSCSKA